MKISSIQKLVTAALCAALCVLLPIAFHSIPNAGNIFAPMHIPVLICGLLCGWKYGLLCGLIGPVLSTLFTGMPNTAFLPSMILELAVYGVVAGVLISHVRTKRGYVNLYISLVGAMLAGRVIAGLSRALIFSVGNYSFALWATSFFITSLPGIAIQLAFIPAIVLVLQKLKLVPRVYSQT